MKLINKEIQNTENHYVLILASAIIVFITYYIKYYFLNYFQGGLENGLSFLCVYAFFIYIYLFYCCNTLCDKIINTYSIFLFLSFLYFFGQHILVLFGKENVLLQYYRSILDGRIPPHIRITTGYFILISMLLFNIGAILAKMVYRPTNEMNDCNSINQSVEKIGWIVLAIVFFPTMYKYYVDSLNAISYGYDESLALSRESSFQSICYFLSYYFLPAFYLLFLTYAKDKRIKWIIWIYLVYVLFVLSSGSRFRVFESMIAIILIYNYKVKEIKWKDIIRVSLGGFIILLLFALIKEIRQSSLLNAGFFMSISDAWFKIIEEGLIANLLVEMGQTYEIIEIVLYATPRFIPFSYGYSIVGAFYMILPVFLRGNFELESVSTSIIYGYQYLDEIKIGMGSSFLAEAYHNFGFGAYIFSLLLGFGVGRIVSRFNDANILKNNFCVFKYAYISSLLCFSIRTDLVSLPRYYVYYVLFLFLLVRFLSSHNNE